MKTWPGRISRNALRPVLIDRVERDHRQSDAEFMRRRVVVGITLVIGAVLLGFSLNVTPGGVAFYALTVALAATWVIGGFTSGPLHLGRINFRGELRRPIILPILLGLALERIAGEPLDGFCQREIFGPLGMSSTAFTPPAGWKERAAPANGRR